MVQQLQQAAPYLQAISKYHANPEVRRLAIALEYQLYSDGEGAFSTLKYDEYLASFEDEWNATDVDE
jgi:hypothetical protein